jgi:hypothetical protein
MKTLIVMSAAAAVILNPGVGASQQATATPGERAAAAQRLVDGVGANRFVQGIVNLIAQEQRMSPFARDIAARIFLKTFDPTSLREGLIALHAEIFTNEELEQLAVFYETALGQKVLDAQTIFVAKMGLLVRADAQFRRSFFKASCVAGVVGDIVQRWEARVFSPPPAVFGPPPPPPPPPPSAVLGQLGLMEIEQWCSCVVEKVEIKFGVWDADKPEIREFVQDLEVTGSCPPPSIRQR